MYETIAVRKEGPVADDKMEEACGLISTRC